MIWRVCTAAVLLLVGAETATAQYFGQNKVQYEQFKFQVLKTDHFDVYYYPEEAASAQIAARLAERWYARFTKLLGHELSGRQPLILYAAHPHFQQTNVLEGDIGEGTGGVTESAKRRIILPFAGGLAETDHVLGHEIVHAFQYDIAASMDPDRGAAGGMNSLPLWFVEGMAEYLSLGPVDANTAMWVRDASSREKMPSVDKLDDPDFFPYRYGQAFWAYVGARWGDGAVANLFRAAAAGSSIDMAMQRVLGIDKKEFTTGWHEATHQTYLPFFDATKAASSFGAALLTKEKTGGEMHLAPALSPDGRRVVFLSERSMFAIEMYVADTETGKVLRRLVKTAGDPHFESLEFIESAGDWASDNRRFVFSALAKGKPVLTIMDVENGKELEEHPFPDLDQIFNPAWSPDGHRIAFSALVGGVLDLFVFDLESKQLTRLTNDPYADYDPEWQPNGQALAWVTDRFSADLSTLQFGNYRIGLMDVATHQARPLAGFETGRNTNPEFSADGRWLYFIGTPDGIPNVYRQELPGGTAVRMTNVLSGVSGITPQTPALSVASAADALVYTVFENNEYNMYAMAAPSRIAPADAPGVARNAAVLPPYERPHASDVAQLLQSPTTGLPPATQYETDEYHAKLSLDGVSQPTIGVGVDRFGAYGGGGLSLLFSDTLGNHQLLTTFQITNRLEEIGGAVAYINRTHRWNWGIVGEQTPYVTGQFAEGIDIVNGQPVIVDQQLRVTQTNRAGTALLQYPFSRAHRIELSGGMRQISFSQKLETQVYSAVTGQLLDQTKVDLGAPGSLNLGEASGALVYDSSVAGATGPILGQRYRLELSQTAGTLQFSGALVDFRKYLMPVRPFTIALRGVHYGRYGRDSEDLRLSPLYLGYPGLVRGYEIGSFDAAECGTGSDCPVFDQLIGSRIMVANAELRFPLVGVFSRRTFYGPLPIEVALFGDAGTAWTTETKARFLGGSRDWVRSAGAALRFNLLGYLIGEIDYVKPLDRPERGWMWQFNFTPGF